jgi:hypothetical protein
MVGSPEIKNDQDKSKQELIDELEELRGRLATDQEEISSGRVSAKLGVGTEVTFTLPAHRAIYRQSQAIG